MPGKSPLLTLDGKVGCNAMPGCSLTKIATDMSLAIFVMTARLTGSQLSTRCNRLAAACGSSVENCLACAFIYTVFLDLVRARPLTYQHPVESEHRVRTEPQAKFTVDSPMVQPVATLRFLQCTQCGELLHTTNYI